MDDTKRRGDRIANRRPDPGFGFSSFSNVDDEPLNRYYGGPGAYFRES